MSERDDPHGTGPVPSGHDRTPTDAELERMSPQQLVRLGSGLDDVEVLESHDKWPVAGTRAERRAERGVAAWFALSAISGVAFVAVYVAWPWRWRAPGADLYWMYELYTPLVGITFGLAVLGIGAGAIAYAKRFLPHDLAVQQRHDGRSAEVDRATTAARLTEAGRTSGIARRSLIKRTAGLGAGVFGLGLGVFAIGGMVRDPWDEQGGSLYTTGWASPNGEPVYLRYESEELRRARPEDLAAGSIATVFPYKESWTEEEVHEARVSSDNPVMLIRLHPGTQVTQRDGQQGFNVGDYFAFSKICTHMGCPASLYEAQMQRLLCPCHQSQFLVTEGARPVFGPATRPLPQLPITVDDQGYFVAASDFVEPVGPAFWELDQR